MEKGIGEPLVSVIIPTWNSSTTLDRLLRSISNQTLDAFEVLVIDKDSSDGTPEIAERLADSYFNVPFGRSEARNYGASKSKGEFLLFVDSDMELTPNVLEACVSAISGFDSLCLREVAVTGKNYWVKARAIERDHMFRSFYYESARFYRKESFIKVGGYDISMVGFEDLDLQARMVEGGFRVGWTDAIVYHHEEDVGLFKYLSKRNLYASTAKTYASRHPAYWRELRSPSRRLRWMLKSISSSGSLKTAYLLPGLVITRALEFLLAI